MTDNTQEHVHNSGGATSCAQRSAQAELVEILKSFASNFAQHHTENGDNYWWGHDTDLGTQEGSFSVAKYAILDWHNKQTLELLDRLISEQETEAKEIDGEVITYVLLADIEAERNKLKERDDDQL